MHIHIKLGDPNLLFFLSWLIWQESVYYIVHYVSAEYTFDPVIKHFSLSGLDILFILLSFSTF